MRKKLCGVCNKPYSNYKCPRCYMLYCSVGCCKLHKSECKPAACDNEAKSSEVKPPNELEKSSTDDSSMVDEEYLPILPAKLESLGRSENIVKCLENQHLRKILSEIHSNDRPHKSIATYMKEPIFVEFVDECLQIISPEQLRENIELDSFSEIEQLIDKF